MKPYLYSLIAAAAFTGFASAQTTAYTGPVGYNTVVCPSNSDTVCSIPLTKEVKFAGTTGVPVDNANGTHSLTLSADPVLDQGAKFFYYVTFKNGTHVGEYYQITNKALGATIVVDDRDVDLTNVANGTLIEIRRFWTLETLFPDGNTTIVGSSNNLPANRRTTVLLTDVLVGAINVAPQFTYFFNTTSNDWKSTASGFPVSDDVILWPDSYFTIRHNAASGPTNYVPVGAVDEEKFTIPLFTSTTGATDNFVSIPRPINVRLDKLGLGDSTGPAPAFVASTNNLPANRGDTLLVYDNTFVAQNKAPSATYFFSSADNNWKSTASGFPISNAIELKPSEGIIIRKKVTLTGATSFWTNSKTW